MKRIDKDNLLLIAGHRVSTFIVSRARIKTLEYSSYVAATN
jgi:hypothetical protein